MSKIIVIPYWIKEVCERNKINAEEFLSFKKASKYLGIMDLAELLVVQDAMSSVINNKNIQSFYDLTRLWLKEVFNTEYLNINNVNTETKEQATLINVLLLLKSDPSLKNKVKERFNNETGNEVVPVNEEKNKQLYFKSIDKNTFLAFMDKEGHPEFSNITLLEIRKDLLNTMNTVMKINEISLEPVFIAYFKSII